MCYFLNFNFFLISALLIHGRFRLHRNISGIQSHLLPKLSIEVSNINNHHKLSRLESMIFHFPFNEQEYYHFVSF
jgi:hypothetical protein